MCFGVDDGLDALALLAQFEADLEVLGRSEAPADVVLEPDQEAARRDAANLVHGARHAQRAARASTPLAGAVGRVLGVVGGLGVVGAPVPGREEALDDLFHEVAVHLVVEVVQGDPRVVELAPRLRRHVDLPQSLQLVEQEHELVVVQIELRAARAPREFDERLEAVVGGRVLAASQVRRHIGRAENVLFLRGEDRLVEPPGRAVAGRRELALREPRALEVRGIEIRAAEIRLVQVRLREDGAFAGRAVEFAPLEVRAAETREAEVRKTEGGPYAPLPVAAAERVEFAPVEPQAGKHAPGEHPPVVRHALGVPGDADVRRRLPLQAVPVALGPGVRQHDAVGVRHDAFESLHRRRRETDEAQLGGVRKVVDFAVGPLVMRPRQLDHLWRVRLPVARLDVELVEHGLALAVGRTHAELARGRGRRRRGRGRRVRSHGDGLPS